MHKDKRFDGFQDGFRHLQILMAGLDEKIADANKFLSAINAEAYKDTLLLSNQVLSRNPFTSNFLKRFLAHEKPQPHSLAILLLKLLKYYVKSYLHFLLYLIQFCEHLLFGAKFRPVQSRKELIVIGTYFLNDRILKTNAYNDPYFPGLEELLNKMDKHYVYLPAFYSSYSATIKTFNLYSTLKILKKNRVPLLTEYQLLSVKDFFCLLYFIGVYPIHVIRFIKTLQSDQYAPSLLRYELLDTIDVVTFHSFSRYLQGKKIAELPYKKIKIISWYENQVIDKNLYKGLRSQRDKIMIYGAQLFLYSKRMLNIIGDDNGEIIGITPDKIICNGRFYIQAGSALSYIVGPSLRYTRLFNTIIKNDNRKDILVLLPYFDKEIRNMLLVLKNTNLSSFIVRAKFHPATAVDKYKDLLHEKIEVVDDDTYKLFEKAEIVIGSSSGTLIEAASLGIPVIVILNRNEINFNPLPEFGKGIIWTEVSDGNELFQRINAVEAKIRNDTAEINSVAEEYRQLFFHEPSEENMIKAFDLNN